MSQIKRKHEFSLNFVETTIAGILILFIITAFAWRPITTKLSGGNEEVEQLSQAYLDDSLGYLDQFPLVASLVTVIFWVFIGFLVYGMMVAISRVVSDLKDVKSLDEDYIHPVGYNRTRTMLLQIFEEFISVSRLAIIAITFISMLLFLLPRSANTFGQLVLSPELESLLTFVGYFFLLLINFMLFRSLTRLKSI